MKHLLHIAPDEKFIDFVINKMDKFESLENNYAIVSDKKELKFIKNINRITLVNSEDLLSKKFISELKNYSAVYIHGLVGPKINFINLCDEDINFVWIAWGGDFYEIHPRLRDRLYLKQTNILSWRTETIYRIKNILKPLLSRIGFKKETYLLQERALDKIKYIAPVIYEDYQIIKETYSNASNSKYINFVYGDVSHFSANLNCLTGSNILLGNSASPSNNHIEAIEILKEINLAEKTVYTPLSYGNKKYAKQISYFGEKKLHNNFHALINFMPLDEYMKIVSSCEIVIMNHRRQQGMGNIYAMIFLGAKLFLREENPAFNFFVRNGIEVFSITSLKNRNSLKPISESLKANNRKIMMDLLGEEAVEAIYKDFIFETT